MVLGKGYVALYGRGIVAGSHSTGKQLSLALALLLPAVTYAALERYWVQTVHTTFESGDIPEGFDGKRIVFISDIHHGSLFSRRRVAGVIDEINRLHPDIILLGGDYVERGRKHIEPVVEELKRLSAPLGVFAVRGNHDNRRHEALTVAAFARAGIPLLDNKATWVSAGADRIKIGGVGDLHTDTQNILPTVAEVSSDDFVILLSHNPDYVEYLPANKVDLMLSGHTHGGQVTLFGLWAPLVNVKSGNRLRTGVIKTDKTTLIVSNGIGTTAPPLRFFARPQINVITLKKDRPSTIEP